MHFKVWAPAAVNVVIESIESPVAGEHPLNANLEGYFSGFVRGLEAGARYRYRLDAAGPFPDACSRFQPQGPHGPSAVVDPSQFEWTDSSWGGIDLRGQVLYELHIGAFTD